jgi:hypothetical protein
MKGAQPGKQPRQQTASWSMVWWCSQLTGPRPGRQKPNTLQQQLTRCETQAVDSAYWASCQLPLHPGLKESVPNSVRSCDDVQPQNSSLSLCQALRGTLPGSSSLTTLTKVAGCAAVSAE